MNKFGIVALVSGTCACTIFAACGAAPVADDASAIGTTSAALVEYQQMFFASDITAANGYTCTSSQANAAKTAALVNYWSAGDPLRIALTEANNCQDNTASYTTFDNVWRATPGIDKGRFYAVPGNHDYYPSDGNPSNFKSYFTNPSSGEETYYRYDLPNSVWTVFALNSNLTGSAMTTQTTWLRKQLTSAKTCILAYFHHPLYSSGNKHSGDRTMAQPLWNELKNQADIVLSGHEHNYERFERKDGILPIVAGTGGAVPNGFGTPVSGSLVRISDRYGIVRLTLWNAAQGGTPSYTVDFIAASDQWESGEVLDRYTDNCH